MNAFRLSLFLLICLGLRAAELPRAADYNQRLAEAELALTEQRWDAVLESLDQLEAQTADWKDFTPLEIVMGNWQAKQAAEIRFIASVFAEHTDPDALEKLYRADPTELFNRFVDDGTTRLSPTSYRSLLMRGRDTAAARGFMRMLELLAADPIKRYRLHVTRWTTLRGLGRTDFADSRAAAAALVETLPAAKLEELAEYRSALLMPMWDLAQAGDYAAARQNLEAVLTAHPDLPAKEELERYLPWLEALATAGPAELARYAAEPDDLPQVAFETDRGRIVITLFEDDAPDSVANFISLVDAHYYDGLLFHRIVPHFVTQGGDPRGTGEGGPGYAIKREAVRPHLRGAVGMARSAEPDSAGSQFYFCLTSLGTHRLDTNYAVFGRVSDGLDVMDQLRIGDRIHHAEVIRRRAHDYVFAKLPEAMN